ncbi:MAG: dihydropteroate synthase [Coriobacteriia bacterium]|nr:dihydropteroate synthase [Coriobacteriia bacterium]
MDATNTTIESDAATACQAEDGASKGSSVQIMGILNVTPDSFSDGGLYTCPNKALNFAQNLIAAGASIIDVGGESSRPGAEPVSVEEELARVLPVIEGLSKYLQFQSLEEKVRISIDSYHPEVAAAACKAGASIINDISGFRDSEMIEVAVAAEVDCVLMHMAGEPRTMQNDPFYVDVAEEVCDYLLEGAQRLREAGIPAHRIFLDPGFGFGKMQNHNFELFLHMDILARRVHDEGYRLLAGISRKSFIANIFGIDDACARDEASAELAAALVAGGANVVRAHNPELTKAALAKMTSESAYIALGSNLGGPIVNIAKALCLLDELPLTQVKEIASPVMSEPAYDADQMSFTNTVCRVETKLGPLALFAYMQAIEVDMGREKTRVNGPRVIDLDLLSYGDHIIDLPDLTVPHPRMNERTFVLEPLQEIAPDFVLPGGLPLEPASKIYGAITARIPLNLLQSEIEQKKQRSQRIAERERKDKQDPYDWSNWDNWSKNS